MAKQLKINAIFKTLAGNSYPGFILNAGPIFTLLFVRIFVYILYELP